MKIEKLDDNKIKISINNEDLSLWGVSSEAIKNNSPEVKELFFSLLRKAKDETGFEYDDSRIMVEVCANSPGDITLLITRVSNENERAVFEKIARSARKHSPQEEQKEAIFEFSDFETVIKLCHAVNTYFGGSLYEYNDKYYIKCASFVSSKVSEFGKKCSPHTLSIIQEHANPISLDSAFSQIRSRFKLS